MQTYSGAASSFSSTRSVFLLSALGTAFDLTWTVIIERSASKTAAKNYLWRSKTIWDYPRKPWTRKSKKQKTGKKEKMTSASSVSYASQFHVRSSSFMSLDRFGFSQDALLVNINVDIWHRIWSMTSSAEVLTTLLHPVLELWLPFWESVSLLCLYEPFAFDKAVWNRYQYSPN